MRLHRADHSLRLTCTPSVSSHLLTHMPLYPATKTSPVSIPSSTLRPGATCDRPALPHTNKAAAKGKIDQHLLSRSIFKRVARHIAWRPRKSRMLPKNPIISSQTNPVSASATKPSPIIPVSQRSMTRSRFVSVPRQSRERNCAHLPEAP